MISKEEIQSRKDLLRASGHVYMDLVRMTGVSDHFAWLWMNGRRSSPKVKAAFDQLTAQINVPVVVPATSCCECSNCKG